MEQNRTLGLLSISRKGGNLTVGEEQVGAVARAGPVSYTHLDVYKRQAQRPAASSCRTISSRLLSARRGRTPVWPRV